MTACAIPYCDKSPPSIKLRRPETPDSLLALVDKMMQKRKEDRYQTAGAFHDAIADLQPVIDLLRSGAGFSDRDDPAERITAAGGTPVSVGQLLAEAAQRAKRNEDLEERIAARESDPNARLAATVLRAQMAINAASVRCDIMGPW